MALNFKHIAVFIAIITFFELTNAQRCYVCRNCKEVTSAHIETCSAIAPTTLEPSSSEDPTTPPDSIVSPDPTPKPDSTTTEEPEPTVTDQPEPTATDQPEPTASSAEPTTTIGVLPPITAVPLTTPTPEPSTTNEIESSTTVTPAPSTAASPAPTTITSPAPTTTSPAPATTTTSPAPPNIVPDAASYEVFTVARRRRFERDVMPLQYDLPCIVTEYEDENGETNVVRGCATSKENTEEECRELIGGGFNGTLSRCHICRGDLCNASHRIVVGFMSLAAVVLLHFVKYIL